MSCPPGWTASTLGHAGVEVQTGFASGMHSRDSVGVQHLRPMNITRQGTVDLADAKFVEDHTDRRVAAGDVLFNNTNSPALVGKTAYVGPQAHGLAYSNHMTRIRAPREVLDAKFVALQMHFFWSLGIFERMCSNHVNQASVSRKSLLGTTIVYPDLSQQRRIVEIIEDHFSRLDAAESAIATSTMRAKITVIASFTQEVDRWTADCDSLGARATLIEYGTSAKAAEAVGNSLIPVLRMGNIQDAQLDWSNLKYLPKDHPDVERLMLARGDLLFNRTNSAELVGKSAVYRGDRPATFASYLIRVRFDGSVDPDWANMVINSPFGRRHVAAVTSQQVGQANVNGTKLRAFPLPVPPLAEQRSAANRHLAVVQATAKLQSDLAAAQRMSSALRRAILAAAFSGRLTGSASDADRIEELASAAPPRAD